jgi:predicted MPP superfamily phosphohydrolase
VFYAITFALLVGVFGIAYGWASSAFPWVALHRRGVLIVAIVFVVAQSVTRWMVIHWHSPLADAVHMGLNVVGMTLGIAAVPLAVLRALSWLASRRGARTEAQPSPVPGGITRRQAVERIGGLALLGTSGAALGWGAVRGRHMFELTEVPVRVPGLPRALDGYVIAQISDIHAGEHVDDRLIAEGLAFVRRARADLIVVTGDLVDMDASFAPSIARKLADLPARDGVTAILGNHDYYAGADGVLAALRAAGIDTLVNQGKVVRARDGGGFALLGADDRWATRYGRVGPDLARALASVPPDAPRILLSHQPVTVDSWAGQVALQLSGHTHGGQINPGFRPAELFFRYVAGAYDVGGTTLYVNRGFGTVGPPSRIAAPPEITRIVLVAG